jgi:Na+-translocating ferredoxin:NAD+ oxidoreductase RnfC subunit
MKKNQLFKIIPPLEFCLEILKAFGLSGFNDNETFSKIQLEKINTIEKLNNLKYKLKEYYLPCKARLYLNEIDLKNSITILRQIVKLYNFAIISKEKYINRTKVMIYNLVPKDRYKLNNITILNKFDKINNYNIIQFD